MMGERTVMQEALFYSFSNEDHVPADHLLRAIDRFVARRDPSPLKRKPDALTLKQGEGLSSNHRNRSCFSTFVQKARAAPGNYFGFYFIGGRVYFGL